MKLDQLREIVENKDFDAIASVHVPSIGNAKTPYGEVVRAIVRLEIEYYNNGYLNANDPHVGRFYRDLWRKLREFMLYHKADKTILRCVNNIMPGYVKSWKRAVGGSPQASQVYANSIRELKQWFVDHPSLADRYIDQLDD